MTQQPNQNYPQPGQGWGQQQQPQQPQWGQPQAQQQPQQPQWGQPQAQQPAYGQQQWGSSTGGPPSADSAPINKAWTLYAAAGTAVVAAITAFFPWASEKVTAGGVSVTITISALGHGSATSNGKSQSGNADGFTKTWGILLIVAGVIALAGALLTIFLKNVKLTWVAAAGAALTLVFALVEALYVNSQFSKVKKGMAAAYGDVPGATYSLGLGWGAYVGIVLALAAAVFAVLAVLAMRGGASAALAASSYGADAYGQQQGYQPPQQQPQWGGQQQAQAQPQWGQPTAQPQWGGQHGGGQQAPNPFADPASQPTQAVQQYPPQPPQ